MEAFISWAEEEGWEAAGCRALDRFDQGRSALPWLVPVLGLVNGAGFLQMLHSIYVNDASMIG